MPIVGVPFFADRIHPLQGVSGRAVYFEKREARGKKQEARAEKQEARIKRREARAETREARAEMLDC